MAADANDAELATALRRVKSNAAHQRAILAISKEGGTEPLSEIGLAARFRTLFSEAWRYVEALGRWFHFNGTAWREDRTREHADLAKRVCEAAAADIRKAVSAKTSDPAKADTAAAPWARANTVRAVIELAKSDRELAAEPEQFDADPWLLNTPGGIVDLRTGALRPSDKRAFMTKTAGATPAETAECPRWRQFLIEAFADDRDLIAYMARVVGYALTGLTREHVLLILFGPGGNGKSVFDNLVCAAFGDYAARLPADSLMASSAGKHPTDVAGLRGARLAVANETDAGSRLDEAKIKELTGGSKITARFMRGDFFEFWPQFQLVIVGNHKPAIRSVDAAIRRRLHLVPFTQTPTRINPNLEAELREELPGILRWAIDGCLEWQRIGLAPPKSVTEATADYLDSEDTTGRWLAEACEIGPQHQGVTTATELFSSYQRWATLTGEWAGTQKRLSEALRLRGFQPAMDSRTRRAGFRGLAVRSEMPPIRGNVVELFAAPSITH